MQKTRIAQKSGAVCINMESYAAAVCAQKLGVQLPCLPDTCEPASPLHFFKNGAAVIRALAEDRP